MPATSDRQRRFMGAELGRLRAGKKTRTGMSASQLEEFAMKPKSKMPKGASMSPRGDLGAQRQAEGAKAGGAKLFRGSKAMATEGKFGRTRNWT